MSTKKPRPFTEKQGRLIEDIISCGLAERDEVEAAFRAKTDEARLKISGWIGALRTRREETMRAYYASLARRVHCAAPGCQNSIEITTNQYYPHGWPEPTRTVTLTIQMQGWHYEGLIKVGNTKTVTKHYYGCSAEHKEAIFRLDFDVIMEVDPEEEERIGALLYPVEASNEARWKVYELARKASRGIVAMADRGELKHISRTILPIAEAQLALVIEATDPEQFTDNLERFKQLYIDDFTSCYLEALQIRKRIDEGRMGENIKYQDQLWQDYARLRNKAPHKQ